MDLLKATCDAILVAEIADCEWDPDTQTITTPQEKKENKDLEEMENATWWNNAFDLKEIGKKLPSMQQIKNLKSSSISMRML